MEYWRSVKNNHVRERIEALQLTNEQVAKRIVKIYEDVIKK